VVPSPILGRAVALDLPTPLSELGPRDGATNDGVERPFEMPQDAAIVGIRVAI
jgi:hypothetical protein